MRVSINAEDCTGCGACVDLCPDVFDLEDDIAVAKVDEVPPEFEETCQEAADECPVEAIQIED